MNKALLDTDSDSEILKAVNPAIAQNAATYRQAHGVLSVSAITVMEIVYGFQRVQNARRLQDFLNAVASEEVLEFERNAAELAGRIAGDLDRTGQTIGNGELRIQDRTQDMQRTAMSASLPPRSNARYSTSTPTIHRSHLRRQARRAYTASSGLEVREDM